MPHNVIKIFDADSDEYKRLEQAARLIADRTGLICTVENTLFDAGQNWNWTTVLMTEENPLAKNGDWVQILCPADQERILYGDERAFDAAINNAVKTLTERYKRGDVYTDENKQALVSDIARLLRKIPASRRLDVQYGGIGPDGFIPLHCSVKPGENLFEAVRFKFDNQGPEDAKYRSIDGDSLIAVLVDIAKTLTDILC